MSDNQLNEMAAKKHCPDCGLTMAKNHYWYKSAWKCKTANRKPQPADHTSPAVQTQTAEHPAAKRGEEKHYLSPAAYRAGLEKILGSEDEQELKHSKLGHIKKGDSICFKHDVEQCGTVVDVERDKWSGKRVFTVRAFDGGYVDNQQGTLIKVSEDDAWQE